MSFINSPRNAVLLVDNSIWGRGGKVAHGLLRNQEVYKIAGILNVEGGGADVFEGSSFGISGSWPIIDFSCMEEFLFGVHIDAVVVGVANSGGTLSEDLRYAALECVKRGIDLVNSSHVLLCEDSEFVSASVLSGAELIDARKPKNNSDLSFWTGEVAKITVPRVAVLGTDCNIGKRTTAIILSDELQRQGYNTDMVYTGQTGSMSGYAYGFILDATLNDFVSGELESTIIDCCSGRNLDLLILEGQSSLLNPAGPCGSEFILSGGARHVVLQHKPARRVRSEIYGGGRIDLNAEFKLIELYGARVVAISVNSNGLTTAEFEDFRLMAAEKFGVPILCPLNERSELAGAVLKATGVKR